MTGPSVSTIRRLFAASGNQCAEPGCDLTLIDESGVVTGQVCHIKQAQSGPRHDPSFPEDELHGLDNLILLCPIHHSVVDSDVSTFTVERLQGMKAQHESGKAGGREPSTAASEQLISLMDTSDTKRKRAGKPTVTKPTVFLFSAAESLAAVRELGRRLEHDTSITSWTEGAIQSGLTALDSLTHSAEEADFAVFVLGRNDTQNLIFELGFLAGRLGAQRVFLVELEASQPSLPSDLASLVRLGPTLDAAADGIRRGIRRLGPRASRPSQFYSCFLSYAHRDNEFARKLYEDLQEVGVRCWFDEHELKAGDRIYNEVNRAIRIHDRLLLILSVSSVGSGWVRRELEVANQLEAAGDRQVLFPVRLDDAVFDDPTDNEVLRRLRERHIADFRGWATSNSYRRAFSRLVQDLSIQASVESGGRD